MLALYAAMFNVFSQMEGISWTELATLGSVMFQGFGLSAVHPGCGSVPDGFLTLWQRVLTLSYSSSITKLEGLSSPFAMILFVQIGTCLIGS